MKSLWLLLWLPLSGAPALAHGTHVEHRSVPATEVRAQYAGGQPMANASVSIYAPDAPTQVWGTGTTDDEGRFVFVPDPAITGNWEVTIRQSGHGAIATIPIASSAYGNETTEVQGTKLSGMWLKNSTSPYISQAQQWLLGGAGVWGFFGTALFFARRKAS